MIDPVMGATPTVAPRREPLRRDTAHQVVAGVCAGIGRHLRIDPLIVRIVFVAAATAGGVGIVLYGLGWVLLPADSAPADSWTRRLDATPTDARQQGRPKDRSGRAVPRRPPAGRPCSAA